MSDHTVNGVTISGAAIDVLHKLFHYGPQNDGGLPSKAGMAELTQLGWADTNYRLPELYPHAKPNSLTVKGFRIAQQYYGQVPATTPQEVGA